MKPVPLSFKEQVRLANVQLAAHEATKRHEQLQADNKHVDRVCGKITSVAWGVLAGCLLGGYFFPILVFPGVASVFILTVDAAARLGVQF